MKEELARYGLELVLGEATEARQQHYLNFGLDKLFQN